MDNNLPVGKTDMHTHLWQEKYTEFDWHVASLSGYECECGAFLSTDDVADILNGKSEIENVVIPQSRRLARSQ